MILKVLFMQYLLLPLIALILLGVMVWLRKKDRFIQNKKLVIYMLIAILVLAIPGIGGFLGNKFSPWGYLIAQLAYLALGRWHMSFVRRYLTGDTAITEGVTSEEKLTRAYAILAEILVTLLIMVAAGYLFTLLFNWLSPYQGYSMVAATCMLSFMLPLLFHYTYHRFIEIPFAIYKVWEFTPGQSSQHDAIDNVGNLTVVRLELTKTISDGRRITLHVKAPQTVRFGDWMSRVLDDHREKNHTDRIDTVFGEGESYGWVFYLKPSFISPRRYIDFEKTIAENHIKERQVVVCRRVINGEEEKIVTPKPDKK